MTEPFKGRPKFNAILKRAEGEWLRELREERGMTQKEVAARLGTSPANLSRMENGADHIPRERVAQFAEIFGIDVDTFSRTVLLFKDPWMFEGLFGPLPDATLKREFEAEKRKYDYTTKPRGPRKTRNN